MYYLRIPIVILLNTAQTILAADILAFFPLPIYSHFSGFNPLFLELANRGHNVTVVSPFPPKTNERSSSYTHVSVPSGKCALENNVFGSSTYLVKIQTTPGSRRPMDNRNLFRLTNMRNVKRYMANTVRRTLELKETQQFLNSTEYTFDLVLIACWYSNLYLALGYRYSASVVCLSPMLPSATLSSSLGTPNNPSYVPSFWLHYSDSMSFTQRLSNAMMAWAEILSSNLMYRHADQNAVDELFSYPGHQNCPPLNTLIDSISLTFVNSHFSVSYARPYPPNVLSVAGMHMRPQTSAVNVDRTFKSLLDGATQGLIYFSFGSNIKTSDMPEHKVRVFVESFKKLSQIVLWKWENGTIDNLPDNVYVDKWFPQQYILSHKNCKLFITHGGYHSLVEALNFGLPVIGFPFYTDQYYNMRFVVENGFGIEILFDNLQENVLNEAIRKIQHDSSYQKNAERASKIFSDLPMSALNTAVYWIEYVIRQGRDSNPIKTYGLSWYQYFLIDVITVIFVVLVLVALFLYKSIKYLSDTIANFMNNNKY